MPTIPQNKTTKANALQPLNDPLYDRFKKEIDHHFNQETRSKKRIHELEQK